MEGLKIVASTIAVNLKDCSPFASQHRPGLTAPEIEAFDHKYQQGVGAQAAGRFAEAVDFFRAAERVDSTFADVQFRVGQCLEALGQPAEAAKRFEFARDYDALRFRADTCINENHSELLMAAKPKGSGLLTQNGSSLYTARTLFVAGSSFMNTCT